MKSILTSLILLLSFQSYANDSAIYANGDGTYTYYGQFYSFDDFPMDKILIIENKVQIFPVEKLSMQESLVSIKPLARKFIKAGYAVETRINGFVIPYIVQKKGQ